MATNTTNTFTNHTGNGTEVNYSISFEYITTSEIVVTVAGVTKTLGTHYTVSGSTVTFTVGNVPANSAAIKFQRNTNISTKAIDFQDGSVLTEADLDSNTNQVLFAQQEIIDKLAGIEEGATGDQTNAEIRTAVEAATDSNVFTDADHSKLNAIEASATADQTASEIRTLVESASDSNVFTDADHSKLNAIEASATADQSDAEIRTAVENATDSNVFTDADHSKLNAIEASADVTDATNVDAAGAVMNSDLDVKGELLVGDGSGDPSALSVGSNGYVLKANSSTTTGLEWAAETGGGDTNQNAFSTIAVAGQSDVVADSTTDTLNLAAGSNVTITTNDANDTITIASSGGGGGSGISNVVEDSSPQLGGNLDVQAREITTSTTNGDIVLNPNGQFGVVKIKGDSTNSIDGTLELACSTDAHGVKIKSPPHSAAQNYTLTLPSSIVDGGFLKTDSNGGLSFATPTDTNTQLSNAEVRTAVEAASDSNVFTDADHTKLNAIAASANNYVHPNHSGEVTSTADGATVIADNIVDEANLKVSNAPTDGYILTAQSGNTGGLTWAAASGGGGGAYEFVSKTSLTSTASQIDFNPTGGLSTGVYKIVGKKVLRTATYKVEIAPFINGGSSVVTGGWDYVYKNYGNYSPYVNNYLQDRLVINHGGTVVAYSGNNGGESFEIDFSTENNSWIRGISQGLGSQLNRIEFSGILRHYNYAPATNRVSGLRFTVDNSGTFNVGTEMILFKLKES